MDAARWYELAEEQLDLNNYKEAEELLNNAIQFDDSFVKAYDKLAVTYIHQGQFEEALATYNQLIKLEDSISRRIKRAGLFLLLEDAERAEEQFQEILDMDPGNLDALKGLGDAFFRQNNFKQAIETYDRVLKKDPDNAFVWYSKAETYYRAQDHEASHEAIEKAIQLEHAPEFFAFKGDFFIRHDNYERALEQYRLAANLSPNDAELRMRIGFIFRILGRTSDALDAFDKALQLDPFLTEAVENKIELLQDQGNREAALGAMEQLVRLQPEDLQTGMELARYYMDNEGYERASQILEILMEVHYEESEVWYALATSLFQIEESERALQAITKAIEFGEESEQYLALKEKIDTAVSNKSNS